ncbi:type II toxin-antitoxin system YafO family toxin [Pseudomonas sp. GL-B-16]|uniref:type II toxin-antitoxin system YafO family toxin n=1 Tax=Pseudomonas sp. GL-B-16 TaxID=2832373 RepID=UPI001CBC7ED9|nr:type II toxin-antitoxin system YafO family toxin [Pseudomonas sp. GL-B-16]
MTAVVISRSLAAEMGPDVALQLAVDFQFYKSDQASNFGDIFGRDKDFLFPDIVVKNCIWHVHMEQPSVESYWQQLWDNNEPQVKYTSDKILIYGQMTDVSFNPYLLLTILDPAGHKKMDDIERMKALGAEYEDEVFAYSARLPSQKWVMVK